MRIMRKSSQKEKDLKIDRAMRDMAIQFNAILLK